MGSPEAGKPSSVAGPSRKVRFHSPKARLLAFIGMPALVAVLIVLVTTPDLNFIMVLPPAILLLYFVRYVFFAGVVVSGSQISVKYMTMPVTHRFSNVTRVAIESIPTSRGRDNFSPVLVLDGKKKMPLIEMGTFAFMKSNRQVALDNANRIAAALGVQGPSLGGQGS